LEQEGRAEFTVLIALQKPIRISFKIYYEPDLIWI
jgi:hypothetical protein